MGRVRSPPDPLAGAARAASALARQLSAPVTPELSGLDVWWTPCKDAGVFIRLTPFSGDLPSASRRPCSVNGPCCRSDPCARTRGVLVALADLPVGVLREHPERASDLGPPPRGGGWPERFAAPQVDSARRRRPSAAGALRAAGGAQRRALDLGVALRIAHAAAAAPRAGDLSALSPERRDHRAGATARPAGRVIARVASVVCGWHGRRARVAGRASGRRAHIPGRCRRVHRDRRRRPVDQGPSGDARDLAAGGRPVRSGWAVGRQAGGRPSDDARDLAAGNGASSGRPSPTASVPSLVVACSGIRHTPSSPFGSPPTLPTIPPARIC